MISLNQALWRKWCYLANDGRTLSVMEYEDWRTPDEKARAEGAARRRKEEVQFYAVMVDMQGNCHPYPGARLGASPPTHGLQGLLSYWRPR